MSLDSAMKRDEIKRVHDTLLVVSRKLKATSKHPMAPEARVEISESRMLLDDRMFEIESVLEKLEEEMEDHASTA